MPARLVRRIYPGLLTVFTVALAAQWLSQRFHAPIMLVALGLGMAFHFLNDQEGCVAGIEFASRPVLRLGVALLGARITVFQLLHLGVLPIVTVLLGVATTIAVGVLVSRWMRLGRAFGVLSGGAVAICGASAALAIGSVLPQTPRSERDTILTIVTVTALSTLAMVFDPVVSVLVGLDHTLTGIFLGGTIHEVAQVVGAGYDVSPETGDVATYVKLLRVTMLLPVVLGIGVVQRGRGVESRQGGKTDQLFLVGFAALVACNSAGLLPRPLVEAASVMSQSCLVMAIAALGTKLALRNLASVGWKPFVLMIVETLWIAGLVLGALVMFR